MILYATRAYKEGGRSVRVAIDRCIQSYNARLSPGEPSMSQVLLARALNLNQSTISRWQSGERAVSFYWATRIAEVLACSLDDLLHLPDVCPTGIAEVASARRPEKSPALRPGLPRRVPDEPGCPRK